jgi:exopolysaccharide biosynthesis polyprenyl glycosylphosphotransferase
MDSIREPAIAARPSRELSDRSRSIRAYESNRAFVLLLSDLGMLSLASWIAVLGVSFLNHSLAYSRVVESAFLWTIASVWTFKLLGLYRISYALSYTDEWYYVITGLAIGVAPLLLVFTLVPSLSSSRLVLVASFGFSALLVGISRSLIHSRYRAHAGRHKRRVALVATPGDLLPIANAMEDGASVFKLVPVSGAEEAITDVLSGSAQSWYDRLVHDGCDEIVFAGMPTPRAALMVERAARDRIAIGFAPMGLSAQPYRLDFLTSQRQPLLVARRVTACTPSNRMLKRLFDVIVSTVGLLLVWPVMVGSMLAILIESGRPVIFRQTRIGRDGKPFEILKLRSMVQNAESRSGAVWAVGDPSKDARTTRVGAFLRKTSIDELPQFINVLLGDVSIVGPRPERPVFVEQFRKQFARYDERHLVRPGVTGWAHVHMRRSPGMEQIGERLDLDLFYIENYSLLLDIFVTFKTGVEVLFQRWY